MHPFSAVIIAVDSITALAFLLLMTSVKRNRPSYLIGFIGSLLNLVGAILSLCFDVPHAALVYMLGLLLIFVSVIPGSLKMFVDMRKMRALRRSR